MASASNRPVVTLQADHPGVLDPEYRHRRNLIAQAAQAYRAGEPIPIVEYSVEEHQAWASVLPRLREAQDRWASAEYLTCRDQLEFSETEIPQLRFISEQVERATGFRMEPVMGLIEPATFLECLADRIMLSAQYIRHYSRPDFTPEPDLIHEVIGHAPHFLSPRLADLSEAFGRAARRTRTSAEVTHLANLYWYSVENGLILEDRQVKACGASLLSSSSELANLEFAEKLPFDPETMAARNFDQTRFQPTLFVAPSLDEMVDCLLAYMSDKWGPLADQPEPKL